MIRRHGVDQSPTHILVQRGVALMHAVRITVFCDECVRIEYAPHGQFCDHPSLFAIHAPGGDPDQPNPVQSCHTTSADAIGEPISVRTRRFALRYSPDGRPPHAGNLRVLIDHPHAPSDVPRDAETRRVLWTPESRSRHNLGGTISTLDGLLSTHPLGDGLLSRDGWHVVDDSSRHLLVNNWAMARESLNLHHNTDLYLFAYGDDYAAGLRALAHIAGKVPLPRRYALGAWYSRYWPYTSDEYRGIVDEFDRHDFPLDVLVLDMDWHKPGWTGWSWNRELIPDPEDFISWVHARRLAVTLNLHPADGVGPHEDRYSAFMRALGREPDGSTIRFDAGDRAHMNALFEQVHRPLEHPPRCPGAGVDFWWVDWQQDKFVRSIPGLTNLRWLNHLYARHTSRPPDRDDPGLRSQPFSRWAGDEGPPDAGNEWGLPATGGWGDHRYPIHFSGDAHTGWPMLDFQVRMTVTAGNIGCFYWSHDIGGHFGPRIEEAMTRWVQFGALSAALRLHSARSPVLDRRPWTYEPRFNEAMRRAFKLRARLMPYIYTCAHECHAQTLPLLRPMYLHHPTIDRAYAAPSQYTLGRDLLCAPITTPGLGDRCVSSRHVWFPPSTPETPTCAWRHIDTGESFEPASEAFIGAPIDRTPIFVRAGVLLPTRPTTRRMAAEPIETLVLCAFPGQSGDCHHSALYEDDGVSLDHTRGRSANTKLTAHWSQTSSGQMLSAEVQPTLGMFLGQLPERAYELHLMGVSSVLDARIDGRPVEWTFDPDRAGGVAVVRVPKRDIRVPLRIEIQFHETDVGLIDPRIRADDLSAVLGRPVQVARLRVDLASAASGSETTDRSGRAADLLAIGAGIGAAVDDHTLRVVDTFGWADHAEVAVEFIDRHGTSEAVIERIQRTLDPIGTRAHAASFAIPARPLAEPPVGVLAQRIARVHLAIDQQPLRFDREIQTILTPLTRFIAVGPFAWDWRSAIADVVSPAESVAFDPMAKFPSRDQHPVSWCEARAGSKWPVDLRQTLHTRNGLACMVTRLVSSAPQTARLHIDAGDKFEVFTAPAPSPLGSTSAPWIKLHTHNGYDAHAQAQPYLEVDLPLGPSLLMIKLCDGGGGWGVRASLDAPHPLSHERPG